jgi:hypothetical protein
MPNWCNNTVELSHKDPVMMERAVKSFNDGSFLSEFIPVPTELNIVAGFLGDTEEQKALELKQEENLKKFGYSTWYDYCVNEWGTKWDISPYEPVTLGEDGRITTSFDSAWSPPIGAYEKLLDLGFEVRAYYYESGVGFCGAWEDGIDDYYEIGGMTGEDVAEMLPSELDEMFCISENIMEWEAENEEDLDDTPHEFSTEGKFTLED